MSSSQPSPSEAAAHLWKRLRTRERFTNFCRLYGVEPAPRKRKGIKLTAYDATPGVREFDRLNRTIEDAYVHCPIAEAFDLEDAAAAHRRMEQGHVLGKVVLRIT